MPRLRGPAIAPPMGEEAWALLNEDLYGSHERGGHHIIPDPKSLPWSWSQAFGREAPLFLEIGFNRGKFITALAKQHPDHNVVGIEIRRRFGLRLSQILGRDGGPRNLRVIWGDAKILFPLLFTASSLQGVFITFPDPWWKKRHFKRRLVDTTFAEGIAERLVVGGHVWVKSDVEMIADEIRDALCARPELGLLETFEQDDLPLTHREMSCVKREMTIYRFKLTRLAVPFQKKVTTSTLSQDAQKKTSTQPQPQAQKSEGEI